MDFTFLSSARLPPLERNKKNPAKTVWKYFKEKHLKEMFRFKLFMLNSQ